MQNLAELYEKIDFWYTNNDQSKINFIVENGDLEYEYIKNAVKWYNNVNSFDKDARDLILGHRFISIAEIINRISDKFPNEEDLENSYRNGMNHYYTEDGYLTKLGLKMANLKLSCFAEYDITYFINNDSLIDCGALRVLDNTDILICLFNYMYYANNMSRDEFDETVECDSKSTEFILDLYPQIDESDILPENNELNEIYKECHETKLKLDNKFFNIQISKILRDFSNNPNFNDKINKLKELI